MRTSNGIVHHTPSPVSRMNSTSQSHDHRLTECDIHIMRVYDAPVARVWSAWCNAEEVACWWGPRGCSITMHERDLRTGGIWRYTMHGPDGMTWPNFTRYQAVEPEKLLVYDHGATSGDVRPAFRMTVRFRDLGGQTALDLTMTLPTAEEATQTRAFIKAVGGETTWDRLAEYLEHSANGREIFVINRSFGVPSTEMFDLWSTPDKVAQWLAPTGFSMMYRRADIRTGGHSVYSMGNGQFTMYGRADYLRVERPTTLEYTQSFTDEHENLSRHPAAPTWPATMRTLVTFAEEGPAQTRVTVRWQVEGEATDEEMTTFTEGRAGMTMGWTGSFDKLEALIAE